jgi:hypothetical protein
MEHLYQNLVKRTFEGTLYCYAFDGDIVKAGQKKKIESGKEFNSEERDGEYDEDEGELNGRRTDKASHAICAVSSSYLRLRGKVSKNLITS